MGDQASVTVRDNPAENRFEALVEPGVVAGFAAYRRSGDRVVFTHTEVDDSFEGQGVGSALVRGALDAVRADRVRVEPRCPFVRSYIEDHQEYADLLSRT
jgi:predicted GNAT family acetyltransferase